MRSTAAALLIAVCSTGCSAGRALPSSAIAVSTLGRDDASSGSSALGSYVKHVVIVIQENRSFDNLFAGFPGADAPLYGYAREGTKRKRIALHEVTLRDEPGGLPHSYQAGYAELDGGKMDGFPSVTSSAGEGPTAAYAYVDRKDVAPYWAIAKQYVLADRMFPTELGDSFTAHLNLIASTTSISPAKAEADDPTAKPWSCDAPPGTVTYTVDRLHDVLPDGPFPCFDRFHTMADSLDAANVSWKYYAPPVGVNGGAIWSEFGAIERVRDGPDWHKVVTPETRVLADIANHELPGVAWVVPDWSFSDHPGVAHDTGPSWVAAIVDTIGASSYWKSTAIVIVWDDWGGWYDDARPPQRDFRGLGLRVPCLVVSPYAKTRFVSHTQYEFGSILKFVEQVFGLSPLAALSVPGEGAGWGYTDRRAHSIIDSFDFTQRPRRFTKIPAPYPPAHFLDAVPSLRPPDTDG